LRASRRPASSASVPIPLLSKGADRLEPALVDRPQRPQLLTTVDADQQPVGGKYCEVDEFAFEVFESVADAGVDGADLQFDTGVGVPAVVTGDVEAGGVRPGMEVLEGQ
jgi:hypothetical protein